jgi:hypothetical protein
MDDTVRLLSALWSGPVGVALLGDIIYVHGPIQKFPSLVVVVVVVGVEWKECLCSRFKGKILLLPIQEIES